jgi:hypothetical protein
MDGDLRRCINHLFLAGLITSVGYNTFPNFVPIFTGYSEEDLVKICYPTRWTKLDDCPFIWKRFDEANYLTGLIEDAPWLNGFDYAKTGFVKQPVDFYSRPFWSAACQNSGLVVLKNVSNIGLSILKPPVQCMLDKTTDSQTMFMITFICIPF